MRSQSKVDDAARQRFVKEVLPVIEGMAKKRWRPQNGDWDEYLAQCVAAAWEGYVSCVERGSTDYTPSTLAYYATCHVRSGRSVSGIERGRSVTGWNARNRGIHVWLDGLFFSVLDWRADPALVVQYRLDIRQWFDELPPMLRKTAIVLVDCEGQRGIDIARQLEITPSRLSQRRRELWENWRSFYGWRRYEKRVSPIAD